MWNQAASALESELGVGEKLLWAGAPRKGLLLRQTDVFLIPFAIIWLGFVFYWENSVLTIRGTPVIFVIWGIPFALIGLYNLIGRFFVDAFIRSKTFYGVTGERIIIASGLMNKTVKSVYLRTLSDVSVERRSDGSGSIIFGPTNLFLSLAGSLNTYSSNQRLPPRFDLIPDVQGVERIIRDAQRQANQPQNDTTTRALN